jgi:hypothetical protein
MVVIHTDALLQYQTGALFTDALAEMAQLRLSTGRIDAEILKAAEVLVIGVLLELGHNALIRDVAKVAKEYQTDHQTDRLGWTAVVCTVQGGEGILKTLPVYLVG